MDWEGEVHVEGSNETMRWTVMQVKAEVYSEPVHSPPAPSPVVSGPTSVPIAQKKMSPLKHVTPILKKYNSQRQAKNGKAVKFKPKAVKSDLVPSSTSSQMEDMAAGMNSLDEALRRAELCMSEKRGKDLHQETMCESTLDDAVNLSASHILDHSQNEENVGQDGDEEGISTTTSATQPTNPNARAPHHRKRNILLKKRNRLQKDLEHALPLVAPSTLEISEEKSFSYALSFFQKVKERLETADPPLFTEFEHLMADFGSGTWSVTDLYHRFCTLLSGHPDLCEDFLGFLLPYQALQCGRFMEHLSLVEMMTFLRRLEAHFAKQPQQLRKIYATWARLAENPDLTLEVVRNTMLPLLKGNTFLIDCFLELLPGEKPPESKMTDFDLVKCEDVDSEHSGEEEAFERVEIPPEKDSYGGENCSCCCHDTTSDPAYANRVKHCFPCGIKFISGKVFLQTENGLRPVRIDFCAGGNNSSNVKRLSADTRKLSRSRCRRGRTVISQNTIKPDEVRQNVETDDESAPSTKTKSPRTQRPPKSAKQSRDKPTSARTLSLGKNSVSRKLACSKVSGSPPLNDQEALPAPDPGEGDKSAALDFSILSDVLRQDREKHIIGDTADMSETKEDSNDTSKEEKEMEHVDPYSSQESVDVTSEKNMVEESQEVSWTREEDRIILATFQAEPQSEKTLQKISEKLPNRSIIEINSRFQTLMSLIQQMK